MKQVVAIAAALPQFFTIEAVHHIREDALRLPTRVFVRDGAVIGFVEWISSSLEVEILWLACHKEWLRTGVGTALVEQVKRELSGQRIMSAKTADLQNSALGTQLAGAAFVGTHAFFRAIGFRRAGVLVDYWGRGQSAAVFALDLGGGLGASGSI